ncbi:MAG: class I SAM-dependent methyltransferase [Chloroflexota bacterium]|jgi:SAM-dependent methyltransferase
MTADGSSSPDPLRPSAASAARAWAERVRAGRAQIERLREVKEPSDFYGPMAGRFAKDPRRTGEPALSVLLKLARPEQTWLDIGAGGGRYALPLALAVKRVIAVDPSPSMLGVLREGQGTHDIHNIDIHEGHWPVAAMTWQADVALMAHVGYDIETFPDFLDAAEAAARRCVVIMRTSTDVRASHILWPEIHGEPRVVYPMLQELLVLLIARGRVPEVTLVDRESLGDPSTDALLASARRMLWLKPGSRKDRRLQALIEERATERDGAWQLDWTPMQDGIVTWSCP